jgi:hypothetical protein
MSFFSFLSFVFKKIPFHTMKAEEFPPSQILSKKSFYLLKDCDIIISFKTKRTGY